MTVHVPGDPALQVLETGGYLRVAGCQPNSRFSERPFLRGITEGANGTEDSLLRPLWESACTCMCTCCTRTECIRSSYLHSTSTTLAPPQKLETVYCTRGSVTGTCKRAFVCGTQHPRICVSLGGNGPPCTENVLRSSVQRKPRSPY